MNVRRSEGGVTTHALLGAAGAFALGLTAVIALVAGAPFRPTQLLLCAAALCAFWPVASLIRAMRHQQITGATPLALLTSSLAAVIAGSALALVIL